jgi:hypothetical protein
MLSRRACKVKVVSAHTAKAYGSGTEIELLSLPADVVAAGEHAFAV